MRIIILALTGALLSLTAGYAQSPCPTSLLLGSNTKQSPDLICSLPQVYGAGGMVGADNGGPLDATSGHEVHFQASTLSSFGPLNSQLGVELSQLPIASPVAGIVFAAGLISTTESYGPVLTDRADTVGKRHLFIGASYQHFEFDKIDGNNLKQLGIVLTHEQEPTVCTTQPTVPCLDGEPIYTRDIIATQTRIDLKVHQVTVVASYGLTDRLDLSLAVPVYNIRLGLRSIATIFNFEPAPVNHKFSTSSGNTNETYIDPFNAIFSPKRSTTGIGDLTIRGKYKVWESGDDKSGVAAGVDVRLPTGDANNFTGAGTWGLRPFVSWSSNGLVSPHATVGFEGNGSSVLAGDVTTQPVSQAKLPEVFSYAAGADVSLGHRANISSDFIGQSLLSAARIGQIVFTDYAGGVHSNIATTTATINEYSISLGGKVNIYRRLLLTGNVLFRVNDAGLHSKPVPLGGLSYFF